MRAQGLTNFLEMGGLRGNCARRLLHGDDRQGRSLFQAGGRGGRDPARDPTPRHLPRERGPGHAGRRGGGGEAARLRPGAARFRPADQVPGDARGVPGGAARDRRDRERVRRRRRPGGPPRPDLRGLALADRVGRVPAARRPARLHRRAPGRPSGGPGRGPLVGARGPGEALC